MPISAAATLAVTIPKGCNLSTRTFNIQVQLAVFAEGTPRQLSATRKKGPGTKRGDAPRSLALRLMGPIVGTSYGGGGSNGTGNSYRVILIEGRATVSSLLNECEKGTSPSGGSYACIGTTALGEESNCQLFQRVKGYGRA